MALAGKHTLKSGKLHLPREKDTRFRRVIKPGDRFDATEDQLKAFGDIIVTYPVYLSLTSDKVEEVEGDDTKPTDKPKAKKESRAKTANKPESEPEGEDPEPGTEPEPIE